MKFPKFPRLRFPILTKTEKAAVIVLALVLCSGTALRAWEHSGVKIGPVEDWELLRKLVLQSRENAGGDAMYPCFVAPSWISEEHWPERKQDATPEKAARSGRPGSKKNPPRSSVDLNAADAKTLQSLPGVGPGTARAIIAYRTEHGKFKAVEELLEVKGIGPKKFEALKNFVHVGAVKTPSKSDPETPNP